MASDAKLPRLEIPDQLIEAPVLTKLSENWLLESLVVARSITPDHSTSKLTTPGTELPSLSAFPMLP